jgi:hypothetical protein
MLLIKPVPWDSAAFNIPAWEVNEYSADALQQAVRTCGHHTIKVSPLADKRLLHDYGFYYCDTLIKPFCDASRLRSVMNSEATISKAVDAEKLLEICHGAFEHARFNRDFNLPLGLADLRYDKWLKQLLDARQVYGLFWQGKVAGFIGYNESRLVLHALSREFRGKGLSKFWWSAVCNELFATGLKEIESSISAANLSVLSLYSSLNFLFRDPLDIYHHLTS